MLEKREEGQYNFFGPKPEVSEFLHIIIVKKITLCDFARYFGVLLKKANDGS